MTRTDIHRPSAPEFDPEAYEFRGCFDLYPEFDLDENRRRIERVNELLREGYHFSSVHGQGQCGHCGASIRYAALMVHPSTMGMIWIGETCLDNRFARTQAEFKRLRETAKLGREAEAKRVTIAALLDGMPENVAMAYEWALTDGAHYIARDVASKLARYASPLSDGQERLLLKLHGEYVNREAEAAVRAAEVASGALLPCPEGRVQITGEILCIKTQDSDFGTQFKMLVQDDRGFKVWGTFPTCLQNVAEKGSRVSLLATVQPKSGDPLFGFFSRPSKAAVIA